MINTVNKYSKYLSEIQNLINISDYKSQYFIKHLSLKPATYYRKLRENTFTIVEITTLTKLLFPKEAYKSELLESIEQGREDFKKGNVMTSDEVKIAMREKIQSYQ